MCYWRWIHKLDCYRQNCYVYLSQLPITTRIQPSVIEWQLNIPLTCIQLYTMLLNVDEIFFYQISDPLHNFVIFQYYFAGRWIRIQETFHQDKEPHETNNQQSSPSMASCSITDWMIPFVYLSPDSCRWIH